MARRARVGFDIFANDVTGPGAKSAERNITGLDGVVGRFRASAGLAAAAAAGIGFLRAADDAQRLATRVRTATKETGDFDSVYRSLRATVQQTGADFESTVGTFQSISRLRDDIGITNQQAIAFGQTVSQLGVIGGASTEAMQRGLLQLNQGLAAGIFRAEEFNSIVENIPELAARLAIEFNKTQGELRQMVLDGELFSSDVAVKVLNISRDVNEEFADLPPTIERAGTALGSAFSGAVLSADQALGASQLIAEVILGVADFLGGRSNDTLDELLATRTEELHELVQSQRVIQRQFDAGNTNGFKEFFGIDPETRLKELNKEISFTAAVIEDLQKTIDSRTDTSVIETTGEDARKKAAEAKAEEARLKQELRDKERADKKAVTDADRRKKETADRIADNEKLFTTLRDQRLRNQGFEEQALQEQYNRERAAIEARKALAAEENPANLDQARQFNAALEDLRLAHVARIAEINDEAVFADSVSAEELHQEKLLLNELRFQEELAQKLGFVSLEELELEEQRRSFKDRQLAQDLAFNDKSLAIIRKANDLEILWDKNKAKALTEGALLLTNELAGHSKALFRLNQAAGIANAVVSTAQGAAKALELGFPLGIIAAAAITAAGLAQIQTIRSASFEGGGSSGGGGGGIGGLGGAGDYQAAAPTEVADIPAFTNEERNATQLKITLSANDDIGERIIEGLQVEVNELGATFIDPNSTQAQVLQSGASL